jgi:4-pyridoxolactonase
MKKTRICLLDGGSLAINGFKLFYLKGTYDLIRFPVYSTLVDHEDGLFLFDTGFDIAFMRQYTPQDNPLQTPEQTIPTQLSKLGIRPEAVTHVINSHLHIDHCAGNSYFPNATFVVHSKEYESAKNPEPYLYQSYSDLSFDPELHELNMTGPRDFLKRAGTPAAKPANDKPIKYQFIEGDVEFAKGLWLYETPGHSAGHMSMVVEVGDRKPMFFTADASYMPRNLEEMIIPGYHYDSLKAYSSLLRVREIQAGHDAELFFPHPPGDSLDSVGYLHAPAWYE